MYSFKTIIEPFRIKSVESIKFTTREQRTAALREAGYNVFRLHAEDVLIDLLTDSGTGAMSSQQWGALMQGDESYAGSRSYYRFRDVIQDLTGFKHIIPTHQGRAAERILFHTQVHAGQIVPNNNHFDTTRANIEVEGAEARDLVIAEGRVPSLEHPFKGNIDLDRLQGVLEEDRARGGTLVPLVMVTITNNSGGGQPVSLENLRGVRRLCDTFGKPFFLDACRFAENAYFIKLRESGQSDRTPAEIAREVFRLADGCTMSAKKDGLANIGGFLAMNDDAWAEAARNLLILTEGFPTYGGLAGYDLEAIARGLEEVVEEPYLKYRIRSTAYLAAKLTDAGVPIIRPAGGHAIYLDARAMLPHVPPTQYPGIGLTNALYVEGGVRGVEIGTVMFGLRPDGTEVPPAMDLVRLAIPRRVYTQSHIDYVAEVVLHVHASRERIAGYRIVSAPTVLRHFTARFEELPAARTFPSPVTLPPAPCP
jgi:tyrosine phenol-lyase